MVERQPADVEYSVRQQDGAWVWEITEQARVLASGCSPIPQVGGRGRVLYLDPAFAWPGLVGSGEPLGNDAFQLQLYYGAAE